MSGKNPLLNPPSGSRKGGDFVKSPDGGGASGKGTDFVNNPAGSQPKAKGKDFVAVERQQPQGRRAGGPSAAQCEESVPEGGDNAVIALDNKGVPGAPAQGETQNLRPQQGGSASPKPYKLH